MDLQCLQIRLAVLQSIAGPISEISSHGINQWEGG